MIIKNFQIICSVANLKGEDFHKIPIIKHENKFMDKILYLIT